MVKLTLRIPDELHQKLRADSFALRRSINDLIISSIKDYYPEKELVVLEESETVSNPPAWMVKK